MIDNEGWHKLYSSILDSSLNQLDPLTRLTFLLVLAGSKPREDGAAFFRANGVERLAQRINLPVEVVRKALKTLEAPDPNSACKTLEGRRLTRAGTDGWIVVNAQAYREYQSPRQAANAKAAKKLRDSQRSSDDVISRHQPSSAVSLDAEEDTDLRSQISDLPPETGSLGSPPLPSQIPNNARADAPACVVSASAPPVSSSAQQEVLEGFRTAYDAGAMPQLYDQKLRAAVAHVLNVARTHGVPVYEAAKAVCKAAQPGVKGWTFAVAEVDPYAPQAPPARPAGRRGGRLHMVPATTGKDFADVASVEEQRERLRSIE